MKSGFVGIAGRPNVGKSTLLNSILGEKIAITTEKPQTTRNVIRGIYTDDEAQIVFIDTPGIHRPRNKLGTIMSEKALHTFGEVDVILFLVDEFGENSSEDDRITKLLSDVGTPKLLIINKIDIIGPDRYRKIYDKYVDTGIFDDIIGISAKKGSNLDDLLCRIKEMIKEGPMFFPADMITDHPEKFIVSEMIREKLLMYLQEEVPHGVAVEIEKYEEKQDITNISAVIYCEKKTHKGIIIGKNGRKLKGVGKSAREEIEALLGTKVFLELWVKVRENWRNSDFDLSDLGYKE